MYVLRTITSFFSVFQSSSHHFLPNMEIREAKQTTFRMGFSSKDKFIEFGEMPFRSKYRFSFLLSFTLFLTRSLSPSVFVAEIHILNKINQLFHFALLFLLASSDVALENRQSWYKPKSNAYESINIVSYLISLVNLLWFFFCCYGVTLLLMMMIFHWYWLNHVVVMWLHICTNCINAF